jgi:hypothetical protein
MSRAAFLRIYRDESISGIDAGYPAKVDKGCQVKILSTNSMALIMLSFDISSG